MLPRKAVTHLVYNPDSVSVMPPSQAKTIIAALSTTLRMPPGRSTLWQATRGAGRSQAASGPFAGGPKSNWNMFLATKPVLCHYEGWTTAQPMCGLVVSGSCGLGQRSPARLTSRLKLEATSGGAF